MPTADDAVATRLDADRKDLLDLSLRNPLLNFRPRARNLEVVGESPAELYRLLVVEGKAMTFAHDPEARDEPDDAENAADAAPRPILTPDPADTKLQTALSAERLEARLLTIYYAARTSIEEQGVNTLFLALGMLTWFEEDSSQRPLRAPLILVPVELQRSSARERFRLRHDGEDPGFNLSLAEKLRAEFRITLPELPDDDEPGVPAYFDAVAAAVAGQPRWEVGREAVALGFFSFGKFLMYRDLDADAWPDEARPGAHPVVRALLADGFHEPPPTVGDDEPIDPHLPPSEARHVLDADSSQALALLDAGQGRNLLIQGPPGTGKSQTIANLIAGAIGRGRSVLFVAEKLAALEVVKRRLDSAGLGDACLELHSHKTSKKAVLAELRRTLDLGPPRLGEIDDDLKLLTERRDRLNAHCEAVNTPIGPSGVTPFRAFGELATIDAAALPRPELPDLETWTGYDFQMRLDLVGELQARLATAGVPATHPFRGSRRTVVLPIDADRLRPLIAAAKATLEPAHAAADRLASALHAGPPVDATGASVLLAGAARLIEGWPLVQDADVLRPEWSSRRADLQALIADGSGLAAIRREYDPILLPEAWDRDLLEIRRDLNDAGRRWWRFASPAYWRARRGLALICRERPPRTVDEQIRLIDAVREARGFREAIGRLADLGAGLFGDRWRGEASDWPALEEVAAWMDRTRREIDAGQLPAGLLDRLAGPPDPAGIDQAARGLQDALDAHRPKLEPLAAALELDPARPLEGCSFEEQGASLNRWDQHIDAWKDLAAVNHAAEACRRAGLGGVVELAEAWPDAARLLTTATRRRWYEGLLEAAFRDRPALAGFEGRGQDRAVEAFRELDRASLRHARAWLAREHWRRLPRHDGGGQLAVLRREFEKKARHLPVRQLLARAGNAVQAIKPVFLMGPMSVASYLAPGSLKFDLVVFDEASQVRPVDALGALLRGGQAVVVGDSRQLPPTRFFDRLVGGDDLDDADEPSSGDMESVLGLFAAQGAPRRMLRWHYRSRHESLIAVSNREFYDDKLVIFPGPDAGRADSGLVLRHLPETVYDRGKTRTNPGEAEAVARAVMDHARAQLNREPGERLTLGVAAFSNAQSRAILDKLEGLRREAPDSEPFFADGGPEPFFVKNLENVQGDERDVIFISVGYGKDMHGKLSMNFGPLNADGGERRLNVLITRARARCEVFTNLTDEDLDIERSPTRGVRAFKTFLAYARTGRLDTATAATGQGAESPFEEAVRSALTAAGHDVRPQVGTAGFRIDLAVVDPDRSGRYLLGIECDGASYHSARSARDRDRLRQQVLEGLGWRLHRIWSTDWFRDPDAALRRAIAAIEDARAAGAAGPEMPVESTPATPSIERDQPADDNDAETAGAVGSGMPAYEVARPRVRLNGRDLHELPIPRLSAWVAEVVRVEGPVHAGEVARRIVEAAGLKRLGNRIQAAIDRATEHAAHSGAVVRRGEFLWPPDLAAPSVRDRSALPPACRRLDLVAPEEIAQAIERAVQDAFGMERAAIPAAALRLLGFPRAGDEMRRRVETVIDDLLAARRLVPQGGHLVPPDLRAVS